MLMGQIEVAQKSETPKQQVVSGGKIQNNNNTYRCAIQMPKSKKATQAWKLGWNG